jgi:ABC-2 type transport system permease protein
VRVTVVFKAITRNWLRSRSGLFFSFLFPVFFLLIFGSILGGTAGPIPITVQNNDIAGGGPTPLSQAFVSALNSTSVVKVTEISTNVNVTSYVQQQAGSFGGDPRVLVIPSGFSYNLSNKIAVKLSYTSSPGDQLSPRVTGVISNVMSAFGSSVLNESKLLSLSAVSSSTRALTQVDYYMPGLIAAFIMTNGVIGLTNIATEFRRSGVTKRLSATPLTKLEWVLGNVLSQSVLAFSLAALMILLGVAIYGATVIINAYVIVALVLGAVLFSGMGMTLAGIVKEPEAAAGVANAISFPMMFLSGTFFPVSIMPGWLQSVASVLPLTYFSESLRDSMVVGNFNATLLNMGATAALAVAFILLGSRATRWTDG